MRNWLRESPRRRLPLPKRPVRRSVTQNVKHARALCATSHDEIGLDVGVSSVRGTTQQVTLPSIADAEKAMAAAAETATPAAADAPPAPTTIPLPPPQPTPPPRPAEQPPTAAAAAAAAPSPSPLFDLRQPPLPPEAAAALVPRGIYAEVWRSNTEFAHEKHLFEEEYFEFIWRLLEAVPQTPNMSLWVPLQHIHRYRSLNRWNSWFFEVA